MEKTKRQKDRKTERQKASGKTERQKKQKDR
jgi:hypothetical protein